MILDQIIEDRKKQFVQLKEQTSINQLLKQIEKNSYKAFSFKKALLKQPAPNIVAEVKRASPSKGLICKDFDYKAIAQAYEIGGAAALSVLTEPKYFLGANDYLSEIKKIVNLPILRKDFIVDPWQVYEAKAIGADALLLIVAALAQDELKALFKLAHELNLDCLVETHDAEEVKRALDIGAEIIGVNNRNLKNFEVHLETSEKLRELVPKEVVFVAESGIRSLEDFKRLKAIGANGVLMGESLVKAENRVAQLRAFIEG